MSRKYFESVGRQHCALGFVTCPAHYKQLPDWVREAIAAGYIWQMAKISNSKMERRA